MSELAEVHSRRMRKDRVRREMLRGINGSDIVRGVRGRRLTLLPACRSVALVCFRAMGMRCVHL